MLSDCLTKTMTSGGLNETLSTGIFDMRPTEESLAIKAKNRKWRASRKEQERSQDSDTLVSPVPFLCSCRVLET